VVAQAAEHLVAAVGHAVDGGKRHHLCRFACQDGQDLATGSHCQQAAARAGSLVERGGERCGGAVEVLLGERPRQQLLQAGDGA
jgi:hypothetical protein